MKSNGKEEYLGEGKTEKVIASVCTVIVELTGREGQIDWLCWIAVIRVWKQGCCNVVDPKK